MKEETKLALKQLAEITKAKCGQCPTLPLTRCCDSDFCNLASQEMAAHGFYLPPTDNPVVPYLGPNGCIVPPEYRPGCTLFVCPGHLALDKEFKAQWGELRDKVKADETVYAKGSKLTKRLLDGVLG